MKKVVTLLAVAGLTMASDNHSEWKPHHIKKPLIHPHPDLHVAVDPVPITKPSHIYRDPKHPIHPRHPTHPTRPTHPTHPTLTPEQLAYTDFAPIKPLGKKPVDPKIVALDDDEYFAFDDFADDAFFADDVILADDDEFFVDNAIAFDDDELFYDNAVFADDDEFFVDNAVFADDDEFFVDNAVFADDDEFFVDNAFYAADDELFADDAFAAVDFFTHNHQKNPLKHRDETQPHHNHNHEHKVDHHHEIIKDATHHTKEQLHQSLHDLAHLLREDHKKTKEAPVKTFLRV